MKNKRKIQICIGIFICSLSICMCVLLIFNLINKSKNISYRVKEDINNDLHNGYSLIIDNIQYNKIPMDINIDDYILTTDETNKEIILIKDKE